MLQSFECFPLFLPQERHFQAPCYLQTTQNKSSLAPLCCRTITSFHSVERYMSDTVSLETLELKQTCDSYIKVPEDIY